MSGLLRSRFRRPTLFSSNPPINPIGESPNTSPAEAALRVIEWAAERAPGATINIFETWPEMEGFVSTFPPTETEVAAWQSYMLGDWHDWWVSLTEMINRQRPDLDVRLISVGPQIAAMLEDPSLGLGDLGVTDLYQDDAPHGTPTLYFLASLVHFTAVYGSAPPSNLVLPNTIHASVRNNFSDIVEWLSGTTPNDLPEPLVDPFRERSEDLVDEDEGSDAISDDNLPETAGSERVSGSSGNDRFIVQAGNETISGGSGEDTAVLSGSQANYTVRFSGDTLVVEDRTNPSLGSVDLRSVEWLDFAQEVAPFDAQGMSVDLFDGIATLDASAIADLTELYIAYFNRAPDAVGLFFWGNQLAGGRTLQEIAELFFDQPETRSLYGDLSDAPSYVTAVYQNVLGRTPDSNGMSFWLDILENGSAITPATFIQEIIAGAKADTGDPQDATYLANKVLVGGHFAVTRGMSDVEDAISVMQGV